MEATTRPQTVINHVDEEVAGPTIYPEDLHWSFCPHCLIETMQVKPAPEGWPVDADDFDDMLDALDDPDSYNVRGYCLQCMADGGTCCSLKSLSRWKKKK